MVRIFSAFSLSMFVAGEKINYLYKYKCSHLAETSHASYILMTAQLSNGSTCDLEWNISKHEGNNPHFFVIP